MFEVQGGGDKCPVSTPFPDVRVIRVYNVMLMNEHVTDRLDIIRVRYAYDIIIYYNDMTRVVRINIFLLYTRVGRFTCTADPIGTTRALFSPPHEI